MDKGDTAFGQSFIVFAEATIEAEPSEGTFHNPTTGQYGETFLLLRAEDRPQAERESEFAPAFLINRVKTFQHAYRFPTS